MVAKVALIAILDRSRARVGIVLEDPPAAETDEVLWSSLKLKARQIRFLHLSLWRMIP